MKKTVKSCEVVRTLDGGQVIYNVEFTDGEKGESFNKKYEVGFDVDVELTFDEKWKRNNIKEIKPAKSFGGGFTPKPANMKLEALRLAVEIAKVRELKSSEIIAVADMFHKYIIS
jgi:hypothetical protein